MVVVAKDILRHDSEGRTRQKQDEKSQNTSIRRSDEHYYCEQDERCSKREGERRASSAKRRENGVSELVTQLV